MSKTLPKGALFRNGSVLPVNKQGAGTFFGNFQRVKERPVIAVNVGKVTLAGIGC